MEVPNMKATWTIGMTRRDGSLARPTRASSIQTDARLPQPPLNRPSWVHTQQTRMVCTNFIRTIPLRTNHRINTTPIRTPSEPPIRTPAPDQRRIDPNLIRTTPRRIDPNLIRTTPRRIDPNLIRTTPRRIDPNLIRTTPA